MAYNAASLPLAGAADFIGFVVVLLVMVVPFLLRVLGAVMEAGKKQEPQRLPRRPRPEPPQPYEPQQQAFEQTREIEVMDPYGRRRPPRHTVRPPDVVDDVAEVVEAGEDRLGTLDDYQRERAAKRQLIEERGEGLGATIEHADERMEAQLSKTFDGLRKHVIETDAAGLPEKTGAAARIRRLLRTPDGMQQAVVLAEILNRPTTG